VKELVLTNRRITICKVAVNFIWIILEYLERQSEHASEFFQIHALPAEWGAEEESRNMWIFRLQTKWLCFHTHPAHQI